MNDGKGCKGVNLPTRQNQEANCYRTISYGKGCRSTPWLLLGGVVVASVFDHGLSSLFILSGEDDVFVAHGLSGRLS